jgi:hypothetical protein
MRQVKFRGKQIEWEYGGYAYINGRHLIINDNGEFEVIPETVGQFTGLLDKNGKEIYEGQRVIFSYKGSVGNCEIIFHEGAFKLKWPDGYINDFKLNPERYTVISD